MKAEQLRRVQIWGGDESELVLEVLVVAIHADALKQYLEGNVTDDVYVDELIGDFQLPRELREEVAGGS